MANKSAICNLRFAIIALSIVVASCGKKGPPLAPIVRVPGAVEKFDVRRVGHDVYLTLTIPSQNVDRTTPSDVQHVDVYAFTGLEAPGARLLDGATLVASIPVAVLPRDSNGRPLPATPKPGEAVQGQVVTVHETLTEQARTPRPLPPPTRRRGPAPLPALAPPSGPPRRFYIAIGYGPGERPGPEGTTVAVPLGPIPDPPAGLVAEYRPDLVRLTWEPSGALLGFLLDRELPVELPPLEVALIGTAIPSVPGATALGAGATAGTPAATEPTLPPPPTRYNVFREIAPDPLVLPDGPPPAAWEAALPVALNPAPLTTLTFDDPIQYDGRERCYHVRAVRGQAAGAAHSEPTPRICVTPTDVTAPVVPTGLQVAEAVDGALTLLWDPNIEEDLAGYLVLRGAPGDATLNPLTDRPVPTARYVDRDVTPGTRYVYAVVALDDRVPLGNSSAESARVEATAP